ncbi:MAG: flagellar hook basal-body protein [Deltaproteobacteria bacterium]|nr:flagellar hook basal-body protein [Deltaproteobacteria bacterium]
MSKGLYVALSGAVAQENALDTVANNVANASSPGYQRLRPVFRQALANAQGGDRSLRYGQMAQTAVDTAPGAVRVTERALDVALPTGTYLAVETTRGERYTRAGNLSVDREGAIRTAAGSAVLGESGSPLVAQPSGLGLSITTDGTIRQNGNVVGKLKLVRFERPEALTPEGSSLLAVGGAGAVTPSTQPITPGALEESNAQPVTAMTELMATNRTFEAFQKVLDQLGEVDRKLVTTVPLGTE